MVKNSFIEKTYVVGTVSHWNCLIDAIPIPTTYVTEIIGNLHFPSIMSIVLTSFKYPELPISIKIPVTLLLHDNYISELPLCLPVSCVV